MATISPYAELVRYYAHDYKLGRFGIDHRASRCTGEYASVAATVPCFTCYLTYDQLGSVRMVTDQNGAVVGRHDYVPYGEEVPGGELWADGGAWLWGE